jgi:hypothetical protein
VEDLVPSEQVIEDPIKKPFECSTACGHYECMEHQDQCKRLKQASSRIDIIGQNGNDGDHYGRSSES